MDNRKKINNKSINCELLKGQIFTVYSNWIASNKHPKVKKCLHSLIWNYNNSNCTNALIEMTIKSDMDADDF